MSHSVLNLSILHYLCPANKPSSLSLLLCAAVSFVRSITENSRGGHSTAGFLSDDRRLNVALTRAKYQLICVGNAKGLKRLPAESTLFALSRDASERDRVLSGHSLGLSNTNREDSGRKNTGQKRRLGGRGGKSRKRKNKHGGGTRNKRPNKGT